MKKLNFLFLVVFLTITKNYSLFGAAIFESGDEQIECMNTRTDHTGYVNCLLDLGDGRFASGSYDKTIKIWNKIIAKDLLVKSALKR